MRLFVPAAVVAALVVGVLALGASGEDRTRKPPEVAAVKRSELPPLPKLRPKVVEPEAGVLFDTSNARVTGSRWGNEMRSTSGFAARHPSGL